MRTFATLFALTAALGLSACDKKEDKPADKKAEAKKDDAKADVKADAKADAKADEAKADGGAAAEGGEVAAAAGTVELTRLGLKGTAPADTKVADAVVGDGQVVQGPTMMLNVDVASDDRPKTEEEATNEVQTYTPKNLKTEKLEDGWAMTFDNEGSMGPNYFVQVRRELGGKSYWCETLTSTPEEQAAALDFCKSLTQ